MKKEILFSIMISFVFLTGLVWADNEVWNDAKDIRGGTFGDNEQPNALGYTFISNVEFDSSITVKANNLIESKSNSSYYVNLSDESSLNELEVGMIHTGNSNGNCQIIN